MKKKADVPVREIFKSYNYDQFNFLDYNRTIRNTRKLEKSIKEIDVTDCCPIVVTKDFHIIDGQHRFTICKDMGRPIYYVVFNGDAEQAMVNLNISASVWRQEEWLTYYCGKSYGSYLSLREFMHRYPKLGISNAILLFSAGRTNSKDFKKGRLADNNPRKEEVVEFLYNCNVPFAFNRPFVNAAMNFILSHTGREIEKLRKKVICVPCFSKTEAYETAFNNLVKK